MISRVAAIVAPLLLAACYPYSPPALSPATQPAPTAGVASAGAGPMTPMTATERRDPVTILVSIDGFRPDYLGHGDTPTLDRLAAAGVSARMRPSFPTMTFPNHYTMVTGLRPDRHGIVNNTMYDPARPGVRFRPADAEQVRDAFWWDGAEPIWVTAEQAGIRTGTMFWPGSDAAIRGVRPTVWVPYAAAISVSQRVDFVLDWLRRPLATRPRFVTLYFDTVDKASHNVGYDSPEKLAAIRDSDTGIRRLLAGLAAMGQTANLIVVSDHGMAPVPAGNVIDVQARMNDQRMIVLTEGPQLSVFAKPGGEAAVAQWLTPAMAHATCWPKARIPTQYHFGTNPRVPDWLCLADRYWRFISEPTRAFVKGEHGYPPDDPAMAALFVANGPAFATGRKLAAFDNVDLYPLLRDLIGLPPAAAIDGNDRPFRRALNR